MQKLIGWGDFNFNQISQKLLSMRFMKEKTKNVVHKNKKRFKNRAKNEII